MQPPYSTFSPAVPATLQWVSCRHGPIRSCSGRRLLNVAGAIGRSTIGQAGGSPARTSTTSSPQPSGEAEICLVLHFLLKLEQSRTPLLMVDLKREGRFVFLLQQQLSDHTQVPVGQPNWLRPFRPENAAGRPHYGAGPARVTESSAHHRLWPMAKCKGSCYQCTNHNPAVEKD